MVKQDTDFKLLTQPVSKSAYRWIVYVS